MQDRFKYRSKQSEMLDSGSIPAELLIRNLRELDFLNRTGGGHAISLEGIKKLAIDRNMHYDIVDLGCGSGDSMKYIARWARKNGFSMSFTGIDKNADAIQYLNANCNDYQEIQGMVGDYNNFLNKIGKTDIIHSSLFCHHFNEDELLRMLKIIYSKVTCGFVINDLQRNIKAYYGAKIMTSILRGSSLSKHDGPVSVMRGFRRKELDYLLKNTGIREYNIYRRPVFRYLVVGKS